MASPATKIRFLTDNNVPDAIANYLRGRGHSVIRMRFHMSDDAPDPIVAGAAISADRVLISMDKDFNSQRFLKPRYAGLRRIGLSGEARTLLDAMKEHAEIIEYQWARAHRQKNPKFTAHVRVGSIRFITA